MTDPQSSLPPAAGEAAQPERISIPTLCGFDHERFLRDYKTPCKPVVIKGAAHYWDAVRKWTPEYFAEHYGDKAVVPSVKLPDTEVPYEHTDINYRQPMSIAEFVEQMTPGQRCYIDQLKVEFFEGLEGDYDFADFKTPDIKATTVWIGSNTRSGLHYDYVDNFFAQIHGSKLAILAAPEEVRNLHVYPDTHLKSQVAVEHPDLKAHPRFAKAVLWQALLEPGDVLYLPRGWWHYFASSERSISLVCWHGQPLDPLNDLKVVAASRDPAVWLRILRDFVWHGLLGRPYRRRLYSPPPTGVMLHDLLVSVLPFQSRRA